MERKNFLWLVMLAALLAGALLITQTKSGCDRNVDDCVTCHETPPWERISLAGGGVIFDISFLEDGYETGSQNVAWAACANNGIYRSVWSEGTSTWGPWTEYLSGRFAIGVDAIKREADGIEYVLAGANGVWYQHSPFTNDGNAANKWDRPGGLEYYPHLGPNDWQHPQVHDVAFWCQENGTYPANPQQSYYVILNGFTNGNNTAPGLYRWKQNPPPIGFVRCDEFANNETVHYDHFYRDLSNNNILYVTSPDGIYKLSGPYANPKFERLPEFTRLENLPIARPPHPATAGLPPLPVKQ